MKYFFFMALMMFVMPGLACAMGRNRSEPYLCANDISLSEFLSDDGVWIDPTQARLDLLYREVAVLKKTVEQIILSYSHLEKEYKKNKEQVWRSMEWLYNENRKAFQEISKLRQELSKMPDNIPAAIQEVDALSRSMDRLILEDESAY